MKLPSVQQVLQASSRTFFRFPVVLLNALVGTAVALILADHDGPSRPTVLFNILFATILGIPFLSALALTSEKKKWGKPASLGSLTAAVLLLATYATTIPADLDGAPGFHLLRLVMLAAAVHFLVAFAPFTGKGELNGFWHYNKAICLRFITAFLFSMVLYAGLAIALAALDNLFGMEIPAKRYFELWIFIGGIFTTWFFLAGVPDDLDALEGSTDYPKVLKIFAQYILLPLVLVYLVILYAYVGKILIEWSWPRGWVSGLILGYGTTGMLLLLLLHPIRDRAENAWVKSASRWFYISLVPLVVMLFLAMYRRIAEYGITEGRYIGVVLAIWLAAMTIYFLASKTKNIKVIPGSLCGMALMMSFGPWGAFHVSESSQVERLRILLEQNSILADGKVRVAPDSVSFADNRQISSIIGYLHDVHGYDRIQLWFGESLKEDTSWIGTKAKDPALVVKMMGLDYVAVWQDGGDGNINLSADRGGIADVAGYDRMVRSQYIGGINLKKSFSAEEVAYWVNPDLDTLTFVSSPAGKPVDSVRIGLRPLVDRLLEEYANLGARDIPPGKMSVEAADAGMKVRLYLKSLQIRRRDGDVKLISYEAEILYTIRRSP
ncbi:MAG TPA: DUF4153 domain-containing protein [Bacteroidota bacterium]|nr:DUF4153 domain-containing protein [Bacteroidota bacterium]